jgi:hypothetical protein
MKTFALRQFVKIKAVFIADGETPGKLEQLTQVNNTNNVQEKATKAVIKIQRKAHTGNFFAGPHCVFDPRLG